MGRYHPIGFPHVCTSEPPVQVFDTVTLLRHPILSTSPFPQGFREWCFWGLSPSPPKHPPSPRLETRLPVQIAPGHRGRGVRVRLPPTPPFRHHPRLPRFDPVNTTHNSPRIAIRSGARPSSEWDVGPQVRELSRLCGLLPSMQVLWLGTRSDPLVADTTAPCARARCRGGVPLKHQYGEVYSSEGVYRSEISGLIDLLIWLAGKDDGCTFTKVLYAMLPYTCRSCGYMYVVEYARLRLR